MNDVRTGLFYYDKDLAQFGNALSPIVQTSSYEAAQLALQRPFQDRYNSRYDNQTWADYMGYGDEYVGGGPMVLAMGPGPDSVVDKRALLTTAVIAGLTTLMAFREKEHALAITAAGALGVAITWGISAGKLPLASR